MSKIFCQKIPKNSNILEKNRKKDFALCVSLKEAVGHFCVVYAPCLKKRANLFLFCVCQI